MPVTGITPSGSAGWRSGARFTLFVLFFASILAFLDRQMLNILVEPIKRDLRIGDLQFSLLQGMAFSAVYCLASFPVAILADRFNRKAVILVSLLVWNAMTLVFGLSTSFGMLLVARMGLAIGEAGLTPAAISIIRQIYPPEKQSGAVAWIAFSLYAGGGLSMLVGGPALDALAAMDAPPLGLSPWRILFLGSFAIGVVGLGLVTTMREPKRPATPSTQASFRNFLAFVSERRAPVVCYLAAGIALNAIVYAVMSWAPAMLMRNHGWSTQQTGLAFGAVYMIGGGAGALIAGRAVPWLRSSEPAGSVVRLLRFACVLIGIALLFAAHAPDGTVAIVFLAFAMLGVGALVGVGVFGFQALFPAMFSARAVAVNFLVSGTLGASLGPSGVALLKGWMGGTDAATGPALGWFVAGAAFWAFLWLSAFLPFLRTGRVAGRDEPIAHGKPIKSG